MNYIVTSATTVWRYGWAVYVEDVASPEEAMSEAMTVKDNEAPDTEPHHSLLVVPAEEGALYRAVLGAERVPDEFQCCGGMPLTSGPGTTDQHTVPCSQSQAGGA